MKTGSSALRQALTWVAVATLTPILGKLGLDFAEWLGVFDVSDGWVFHSLRNVVANPFYWPIVTFLAGLWLGMRFDAIARRRDGRRRSRGPDYERLGLKALGLAHRIADTPDVMGFGLGPSLSMLMPDINSLLIDFKKANIPTPQRIDYSKPDKFGNGMIQYFNNVGTLLKDGHIEEAKSVAETF